MLHRCSLIRKKVPVNERKLLNNLIFIQTFPPIFHVLIDSKIPFKFTSINSLEVEKKVFRACRASLTKLPWWITFRQRDAIVSHIILCSTMMYNNNKKTQPSQTRFFKVSLSAHKKKLQGSQVGLEIIKICPYWHLKKWWIGWKGHHGGAHSLMSNPFYILQEMLVYLFKIFVFLFDFWLPNFLHKK